MSKLFPEIMRTNEVSFQEILANLLDGTENLELKTHIHKPRKLASLYMYGEYFIECGLKKPGNRIINWIRNYLGYMVSYKRLSRTETIKALSSAVEQEQELTPKKKLTSRIV